MLATSAVKSDPASPLVKETPPGAPVATPTAGTSASARDAAVEDAYRGALAYLGARRADGHLDSDLALKAAEQLGHRYRENHGEAADERRQRATRAAHQIRSELTGNAFQALGNESQRIGALLAELRRRDGQHLAGWEQDVIASATRLNAIATRVADLARSHIRATADSASSPGT